MAFGINDEVVETTKPFGVDDEVVSAPKKATPTDEAAVPSSRLTPQQIERNVKSSSIMPAVEGEGGAAFGVFRRPSTKAPEPVEPEQPKIGFKELYTNPDYFDIVKDYQKVSGQPAYKEGESKEEYVKDFMGQRRFAEINTIFGAVPELTRLKNSEQAAKEKVALGRKLYEETASATDKEGQPGLRPYWDAVKALATDPMSYAGFGVGKGVAASATKAITSGMAESAILAASKAAIKKGTIAGGVTEGVIGGAADITGQRAEQQTAAILGEEVKDISLGQTAAVSLFSGLLGAGSARATMREQVTAKTSALAEALKKKAPVTGETPTSPPTPVEKVLADAMRDNMDDVHTEYMKQYGKQMMEQIDPANIITDSKVKNSLSQSAVRLAMKVMEMDPAFQLKPGEQISTAINKVFANIDTIDDVALEAALNASGMTPRQFAAMNKMSVSEAAKLMQQYSVAAKAQKRMANIDPDFEKQMKALYGADNETVSATSKFFDGVRAVERESKAWITSGIDTTARNLIGTNVGLTAKAAVQLMEGFVYTGGVAIRDAATGKGLTRAKKAMGDTVQDAFDTFFYLRNNGLAGEVTDELLKHNPSLRNNIITALQEDGDQQVSQLARWAQSLNVSVDAFYRKAAFTASIEKQLRDQGIDLYKDILAKDKQLPAVVLKKGIDDALKTTLSYMPKKYAGAASVDQVAETAASHLVGVVEKTPFMSLAIPFPRFMANAMAFQYRYSPLGSISVGADLLRANKLAAAGDDAKAFMVRRQAGVKAAEAAVGTAALLAAIDYREKHQDTPWYEAATNDGNVTDVRALFPAAPYFAVADLLVKHDQGLNAKSAEAFEAVVGMKMPAGTQATFIDQITAALDSERDMDKFAVSAGKIVGDFMGRFTQPFVVKNIYDYIDLVRGDEATKARNPNIIEGAGAEAFGEAALQRVAGKLPVAKEQLPAAVPRLREGDIYKEGEFFNRLIGFRQVGERSDVEKEVTKLGIDPYRVFGSSTGDKEYDNYFIEKANAMIIPRVKDLLKDPAYQALPLIEKKQRLSFNIAEEVSRARDQAKTELKGLDYGRLSKQRFNSLPADIRKIINNRYAEDHDGVTLEQAKDYLRLDDYERSLIDLKYATGGLVDQTNKLLSRQ